MTEPSRALNGRLCTECRSPLVYLEGTSSVRCQSECGYERAMADRDADERERAEFVDFNTCWDCE